MLFAPQAIKQGKLLNIASIDQFDFAHGRQSSGLSENLVQTKYFYPL